MGPKSIEWRSVNNGAWHLFIGSKSICNRAYSNGTYECADAPPKKTNICGHCTKAIPSLRNRLAEVTKDIK